ncbi:MAG: hypothetical protein CMJ74_05435 [Planctomycetaceae bacterium]|nr:hypothetical protein [Planctomycetaceae bacterium]
MDGFPGGEKAEKTACDRSYFVYGVQYVFLVVQTVYFMGQMLLQKPKVLRQINLRFKNPERRNLK